MGQALLSAMSEPEIAEVLRQRLPRRTANAIARPTALQGVIAATRARGYAIDDEENAVGLRCVAAPIFDEFRRPYAADLDCRPFRARDAAQDRGARAAGRGGRARDHAGHRRPRCPRPTRGLPVRRARQVPEFTRVPPSFPDLREPSQVRVSRPYTAARLTMRGARHGLAQRTALPADPRSHQRARSRTARDRPADHRPSKSRFRAVGARRARGHAAHLQHARARLHLSRVRAPGRGRRRSSTRCRPAIAC